MSDRTPSPAPPPQVENCLTTKAVPSEQYIEEVKAMRATLLQQCPHLARWGLGSNKVRTVISLFVITLCVVNSPTPRILSLSCARMHTGPLLRIV